MKICYYEGKFLPAEAVSIPVSDHVIQRGVGVFDLVRTSSRRPVQLTMHLERLFSSAAQLGIEMPWNIGELKKLVLEGIGRLEGEVLAKVFVTGGDSFVDECRFPSPRLFCTFEPLVLPPAEVYQKGVRLYPVLHGRTNPTAKSIDYASSYEKNRHDPEAFEVVYCPDGQITEAAHSTFFLVKDGVIITAPSERVLAGTTRAILLQLMGEARLPVQLRCPRLDEITQASEAFITGSIKGVAPVVAVGELPVGSGAVGPVTARVAELLRDNLIRWTE